MGKELKQIVGNIAHISGQVALIACTGSYRPQLHEVLSSADDPAIRLEVHSYKNSHECYCLILSQHRSLSRRTKIISTGKELTLPLGLELLGRVVDIHGEPLDGRGDLPAELERRSVYETVETIVNEVTEVQYSETKKSTNTHLVETGIKAIDFFTPLPRGAKMGLVGGPGVGKTVLMTEIMRNINSQGNNVSIFAGIGERIREGHELWKALEKTEVLYRTALILGHMNENAAVRFKVAWAAATLGEYFRDVHQQNVLFFVDNIFRFVQAGSELSTLLGEIPSEFGYQPTLQTEVAQFESRLKSTPEAAITSIQTIYAPADMLTNPVIVDTLPHLAATIILSRDIAHKGRFPAIDIMQSKSSVIDPDFVGREHYETLTRSVEVLNRYERLSRIAAIIGEEELSIEDRKIYQRAQKILNYMTQPFFTASTQTGRKGAFVQRDSVVRDVKLILQGRFDAVPAEQMLYIGDMQEAGFSRFI